MFSISSIEICFYIYGIYLALTMSKTEVNELSFSKFVPVRVVKKGGKSKIKISSPETPNTNLAKCFFATISISQTKGGPIGLRLSMAVK